MRIGILGGYFDPPTNGHVEGARFVLDNCPVFDEIWMTPRFDLSLSDKKPVDYEHRLNMCKLACQGYRKIVASDIEAILRPKNTYELLTNLKKHPYNMITFYMIIGMDEANVIKSWVEYEKLINENRFIVIDRPGFSVTNDWFLKPPHIYLKDRYSIIPNASSSNAKWYIRRRDKAELKSLINSAVYDYVKENKLYEP